jgi:general stress protein 26
METIDSIDKTSEEFQKLESLLKELRAGMLTTIGDDEELHSRPMYLQKFDPDSNELWFFAGQNSGKVVEIQKNSHVHLSFADASDGSFLSICGQAKAVDDFELKKQLWNVPLLAWFPQGLDDPNLTLICVKMSSAEYWDAASKFVQLFGYTKAILKGERYKTGKSEHGRLGMS